MSRASGNEPRPPAPVVAAGTTAAAERDSSVDPVVLDAAIASASLLGLAALAGLTWRLAGPGARRSSSQAWLPALSRGRRRPARRAPAGAAWIPAVIVLGAGIGWLAVSYVR